MPVIAGPVGFVGITSGAPTIKLLGWFGPRGLASIVFLLIGMSGLEGAGADRGPLMPVVAWTVMFSVLLHGLTAGPFAARCGRMMAALRPCAPELDDVVEPTVARATRAGTGRR